MDNKPYIVWIDDTLADSEMGIVFRELISYHQIEFNPNFTIKLIGSSDDAIEFIIENKDEIFLIIQDSSRREGKIIPSWKKLNPKHKMQLDFNRHQGDFYTYVIDAFTPSSGAYFSGFSYLGEAEKVINNWGKLDDRITFISKLDLTSSSGNDAPNWISFGNEQLEKWKNREHSISPEGKIIKPLAEEIAVVCGAKPNLLDSISPRQFEELIASLFKNHGFTVELTSQTKDGGYDIIAATNTKLKNETVLIEVKHFSPNRPVGVGLVRALYGVKKLNRASKAILATSSYVTKDAKREFSRVIPWEIDFIERQKILEWCTNYLNEIYKNEA